MSPWTPWGVYMEPIPPVVRDSTAFLFWEDGETVMPGGWLGGGGGAAPRPHGRRGRGCFPRPTWKAPWSYMPA